MRGEFYYGWVVVAALALIQGSTLGLCLYGFPLMVVSWVADFGVSRGTVMTASLAMMIASVGLSPVIGIVFDRWPARVAISIGLMLFTSGLALVGMAQAWWQIVLVYALPLSAAIQLAGSLGAQVTVTKWFTEKRGMAVTLTGLGTAAGGLCVPPLLALLINEYGWRSAFLILSAGSIALVALAWVVLSVAPPGSPDEDRGHSLLARDGDTPLFAIVRTPQFWIYTASTALLAVVYLGVVHNIGAHAHDHGIGLTETSALISVYAIGALIGKIIWAGIIDRLTICVLYMLAALAMAAGVAFVQNSSGYIMIAAGMSLIGFSSATIQPIVVVGLSRHFGARSIGRALGLGFMVLSTGGAVGPPLAGMAYDRFGSYDAVFFSFFGLLALGTAIIWIGRTSSAEHPAAKA